MLHVVPDTVLNAAGLWEPAVSILDTQLSVPHRALNLSEFVDMLCADVGTIRQVMIKGNVRGMLALKTRLPAQERTALARTLLVDALSMAPKPLSWLLMYDPPSATYYLSVVPPGAF
jgi:hypothetical protein